MRSLKVACSALYLTLKMTVLLYYCIMCIMEMKNVECKMFLEDGIGESLMEE